jgi:hypothetical protein
MSVVRTLQFVRKSVSLSSVRFCSSSSPLPIAPNARVVSTKYSTAWPHAEDKPLKQEIGGAPLPRTIPDDVLNFQMKATFTPGSSIFYPHLKHHPADYKVGLVVKINDLNLNKMEAAVFKEMVGPRFNQGKGEVRLTGEKFPNRLENRKYLIYLLENLLADSRRIAAVAHEFNDEE